MKTFIPFDHYRNYSANMNKGAYPQGRSWPRIFLLSFFLILFSSNINGQFTLNGLPEEWPGILNNAGIVTKVFVHDPNSTNDNQFTTGSQDPDLIAEWGWVIGNTNNKGDISNSGAALLPGNILAFFGDRVAINGDAQIGFWFFKSDIHPLGSGLSNSTFTTEHQVGDLLVLSNFTNGGGSVQLRIFKWVGSGGSDGSLDLVGTTGNARVNSSAVAIPAAGPFLASFPGTATWTYQGKNVPSEGVPPPNTYHTGAYFEGFIDLDAIPGASPCIQSFLLETRNSQSTDASLQDFVQGGFNGVPLPPTVVGDEICFNARDVSLSASCTGSTVKWYANPTGGAPIQTGSPLVRSGLAVGTHTFYASCSNGECESARVPVTARINPYPAVDGVVTEGENNNSIDDGITKLADDVYQIRIAKTTTANLIATASGGSGSYSSYVWEALDANAAISFVPNGANAVFTVLSTQGLNTVTGYHFKVTLTDSKGCTAEDTVTIVPVGTAITCEVNGPAIVCAGSTSNVYTYLDGLSTLDPDFNYTWSISGNGTINGAPKVNVNSVTVTAGAGAGSYTVTLTITGKTNSLQDPPACSKIASVTLVTLSLVKTDLTCGEGNNGTITATFSGGTAPYNIRIDGGSYTVQTSPYTFTGLDGTEHTVDVYDANNCADQDKITPGTPNCCVCVVCDGEVVVNQHTSIDFNTNPPTYTGDPDLLPYFSYDKSGGATADKWKAQFNLGAKKLTVTNLASITVSQVNGYAPGIEINSTCDVTVDNGASIKVISANRNAGDVLITASGIITINGEVRNQLTGTLGLPGAITITSTCANINVGGLVQILGTDGGGNTITLVTCQPPADCIPAPFSGDITITGLLKSYAAAHSGDLTLNRPNIRVVSMNGRVVINANTAEPLYDEFSVGGGLYDIYGGLLSWVSANVNPGTIQVQAKKDVVVNGHGTDPTGAVRKTYGAIAAIATASDAPGGFLDIRSLEGRILGTNRAFDVSGRNRLATNFAHILLNAKTNIELSRPGATNNFNPVVNAAGLGSGDKGGTNELRSYSGSIIISSNALVTAAVPSGTQGVNNLTSCTGVTNNGSITPAAVLASTCSPAAPDALYTNCPDIDGDAVRGISAAIPAPILLSSKKLLLSNYPNPFSSSTTISYTLPVTGFVSLKVYNMMGAAVAVLVSENQAAGEYSRHWNPSGLPSGVYYVRIRAGEYSGLNKLVLDK